MSREGTFRVDGTSEGEVILKVRGGIATVDVVSADWVEEEILFEREQREIREREEAEERILERRERRRERRERERQDG